MSSSSPVSVELTGAVCLVTLDRPEKLNALSREMVTDLTDVVETMAADPAVRALVLRGAGRMFSAGADVDEFSDNFDRGAVDPESTEREARAGTRLTAALESPDIVTICAVHTAAIGGAAALVAACDLRLFATGARMQVPELAMGFPLAWGGLERLVRDLGPSVTRDLLLTGRSLGADEALARGFACAVVDPDELGERARALAERVTALPAYGTGIVLRRIRAVADRSGADGVDDDARSLALAAQEPEAMAAARAYLASLPSSQRKP